MSRWAVILAGTLLVTCSIQPAPDGDPFANSALRLQWPAAPGQDRIQLIGAFSSPSELGFRASISARFMNILGGGRDARLVRPFAIQTHGDRLVIADPGAGQVISIDRKRGKYSVIGTSEALEFSSPVGIALGEHVLYVADSALGMVFKFDDQHRLVKTMEQFNRPTSLAWDERNQWLYVTDTANHHIVVVDKQGNTIRRIGSHGAGEGEFNFPTHICLMDGRLLVVDALNFRVQVFSAMGVFLSSFGTHGDQPGQFAQPKGIAADRDGHIYIAESVSGRIQVFDLDGVFLMAFGSNGNGPGNFLLPAGIHIEGDRIYIADSGNGRIQLFEYRGPGI